MPDLHFITILGLGFLLGARHALDTDHIVAVSTMLARAPDLRRSGLVGLCWGVGHTAVLLAIGLVVLALQITIPESVAQACEAGVGVMLIVLGGALALTLYREHWHLHTHAHDGERHLHLHSHSLSTDHSHRHGWSGLLRPVLVGMVHGLAGSAALMLVVLSTVRTPGEGVVYILVFGLGSILGMVALGILISVPFIFSFSQGRSVQVAVQGLASVASIGFGLALLFR
ncbi:MAG: sulfite exporter TauE/SafE family protein [Nitrospiraceae bacterium]